MESPSLTRFSRARAFLTLLSLYGIVYKRTSAIYMIQVIRERYQTPENVARRLELAGGRNRYGEPNYRAVWGWSRLGWIGGRWTDRNDAGDTVREVIELCRVPKYTPQDRWHIERWMPPESYGSPANWYSQTIERENGVALPGLGPYPERGEYEHCFTL